MIPLIVLTLMLAAALRAVMAQASQPPATVYLMRHAEKLTDGRPDLAPAGFERATLLPGLFNPLPTDRRIPLPAPQVLFAAKESTRSNRSVQTLTPLASSLRLAIDSMVANDDFAILAAALLSGKYAGKVVLVAWHHGTLASFATALGVHPPPAPWPETQFDHLWRIDYVDGKARLSDLPQHLLPADLK